MAQQGGPGRMHEELHKAPAPASIPEYAKKSRPKGRGLWAVLCSIFVLVGVGIILHSTLFRLKRVQVIGSEYRTPQEVVTIAGIAQGDNILLLDEDKIRDNINKDRYLIFQNMQRDYPDGLIIQVYERIPRANIQTMGEQYTLDGEGMVLEQTQTLQLTEGLVAVTGLQITSSTMGRYITCQKEEQLVAYRKVMSELALQETISQISELNLADMDNLYLVSLDGFTVRLGNDGDMQAKIGAMRAVLDYLHQAGRVKGSIDVSAPINPTYIPAE
jgi:cell division protein FtsQ